MMPCVLAGAEDFGDDFFLGAKFTASLAYVELINVLIAMLNNIVFSALKIIA